MRENLTEDSELPPKISTYEHHHTLQQITNRQERAKGEQKWPIQTRKAEIWREEPEEGVSQLQQSTQDARVKVNYFQN